MQTQTPTPGRIVNYVLEKGPRTGEIRPAIIVRTYGETTVQLAVFTDGQYEAGGNDKLPNPYWVTSACYSETPQCGTWHWPQRN